jgi:hypothetical protein
MLLRLLLSVFKQYQRDAPRPPDPKPTPDAMFLDAAALHRRVGAFRTWANKRKWSADSAWSTLDGSLEGRAVRVYTGIDRDWANEVGVHVSLSRALPNATPDGSLREAFATCPRLVSVHAEGTRIQLCFSPTVTPPEIERALTCVFEAERAQEREASLRPYR